jgi:tungstate transport system substrate-binding protein
MTTVRKLLAVFTLAIVIASLLGALVACGEGDVSPLQAKNRLRVATTTSLYDTGLWGYLEPKFEDKYNVELDVLYAGTGKAIEWGTRGDVDVIAVHDKAREVQFVADGYGVERVPFAFNYFLIVGPASDPAGISGLSPEDAFKKLMAEGQTNPDVKFVSRGDGSGTHAKEKAIWASAGYEYADVEASGGWYIEGGSGMGPTLVLANEKDAYTLSDIGTFLAYQSDLNLVPVVDEGDVLLNVYSVIATTSTSQPEMANNLVEFLTSDEIQKLIGEYGVKEYGRQLFTPCAGQDL